MSHIILYIISNRTINISITGLLTISVLIYWYSYQLKKIKLETKRQELRDKQIAIVKQLFPTILSLHNEFSSYLEYKSGYFNNKKLSFWLDASKEIFDNISKIPIAKLNLEKDTLTTINNFILYFNENTSFRHLYNEKFISHELKECDSFFSNIDNVSLDEQQRLAIVQDEDNNLVIAGAGSGKTTTVAGKVAYIINRFEIKPEEILLITYTRKASDEMKNRIAKEMNISINVNTFHSFGRKVIGEATNNMPSVIDVEDSSIQLKKIFDNLSSNSDYVSLVIKFITEYRLEAKDDNDFKSHGEYITYLKDNNIKSYKTVETIINGRRTMLREKCKSLEEVKIANYLFLNGVEYKYEEPYQHMTADNIYAQYKPDFYLPDFDIYIEHFGLIDRNNNVPNWFSGNGDMTAKDKYNSDIAWKRKTHSNFETTLVETYSYENKEGVLFENLKEKLEAQGVVFKQRTNEEIWEILISIAKDEVSALDTLIGTFLNLFKSNNFEIKNLTDQIATYEDENIKTRYLLFLDIFTPILTKYNEYLKSKNLIDFNDMINDATNYISKNKFKNKFKYIIIDEFQDTSIGRFRFVKALLDTNNTCRLFAVGDDWQSIYRFTGSDISLFTQFEKYFGVTVTSKIETTYRFGSSMIDISSKFILANSNQTRKQLKAFTNSEDSPISIVYSNSFRNDDFQPFISILNEISERIKNSDKAITIIALARYNHVIDLYKNSKDVFTVKYNSSSKNHIIVYNELPNLQVEFLTVHRSKGLQADYIILLNCISGKFGFPSEQADDPILNLLLSKSDQFPNGEERRLFYVALTRSKRKTFITTNSTYKSKFINEVDPDYIDDSQNKCPQCKLGDIKKNEGVNRYGNPYVRITCSNWNFGCEYIDWN